MRSLFRKVLNPLLSVMLCGASTVFGQDSKPGATWYHLEAGDTYYSDFSLKPGETKDIDIPSSKELVVGFLTDLTSDQFDQIKKTKGAGKPWPGFTERTTKMFLSSAFGGAWEYDPSNGIIKLTAENRTPYPLKFVIYTSKSL